MITTAFEHPSVDNVLTVSKKLFNATVTKLPVNAYGFNNIKFVHSISFMNPDDSLDKLVNSLRNGDAYNTEKFKQTEKYFFKIVSIYER